MQTNMMQAQAIANENDALLIALAQKQVDFANAICDRELLAMTLALLAIVHEDDTK
jgi:hypothetical protein